jgi:hypothetical protein
MEMQSKTIDVVIKANAANVKGTLELNAIGFDLTYNKEITIAKKGDELIVPVAIKRAANAKTGVLQAKVVMNGKSYDKSIQKN